MVPLPTKDIKSVATLSSKPSYFLKVMEEEGLKLNNSGRNQEKRKVMSAGYQNRVVNRLSAPEQYRVQQYKED